MKVGETVRVRDFEGKTLIRRVVGVRGDVLMLCTHEEYTDARRQKRTPTSVGFKRAYLVPSDSSRSQGSTTH